MSKGKNSLKILYIIDILKENSKEHGSMELDRYINANKIIEKLKTMSTENGDNEELTADRKSVYTYIKSLITYGFDIETDKRGYYLKSDDKKDETKDGNTAFELAELRLIADALNSSRFIPAEKAERIIEKLMDLKDCEGEKLGSLIDLKASSIFQGNPYRSDNNSVIYNINNIHQAIVSDKKITFNYLNTVVQDDGSGSRLTPVSKNADDGKPRTYELEPIALVWKNEYYYALCYDEEQQKCKTFRVDRMKNVFDTDGARVCKEQYKDLDISSYTNTAFSMFGGEEKDVTLRVSKRLAGVIADRFGFDTEILDDPDESFFRCRVRVQLSDQFFSWLSGFGADLVLFEPQDIRGQYTDYLNTILNAYK